MTRRRLTIESVPQIAAEVQRLHKNGYTATGNWDLSQIAKHLSLTMAGSMSRFPALMPWLFRVSAGKFMLFWVLRSRTMPAGVPSPKGLLPGEPGDEAKAVKRLVRLCEQAVEPTTEWAVHPMFGTITGETWCRLHCLHAAHHLSFLEPRVPAAATAESNTSSE